MSLLRTGFWLTTLLLSACSLPVIQNDQAAKLDNVTPQKKPIEQDTSSSSVMPDSLPDLLAKLDSQSALADLNYIELKSRLGAAPTPPKLQANDTSSMDKTSAAIQRLRSYNSKTSVEISSLDARVEERQKKAINGDLIQIFLSDTKVSNPTTQFKAQPLVGQWIRGESRIIRLKDNLLFESPQSEDLKITYSESYQLLVNDQVIASVNPNKEKNNAIFTIQTTDKSSRVTGKLDYRVIHKK